MRLLIALALVLPGAAACGAQQASEDAVLEAAAPATAAHSEGPVPAPGPATGDSAPGQQVLLHHCGVQPVTYEGERWEVENPPFDLTNAPDGFSGFGTFRRGGEVLTFTDREGARLTFTPDDGTPDPYTCA